MKIYYLYPQDDKSYIKLHNYISIQSCHCGASLVAQWLGIRLPVQATWVQALVREDPTCRAATKPMHHNY